MGKNVKKQKDVAVKEPKKVSAEASSPKEGIAINVNDRTGE